MKNSKNFIWETYDFSQIKDNKSKQITKAAIQGAEDYKKTLIDLEAYNNIERKYINELNIAYNTLMFAFKGAKVTEEKINIEETAKYIEEYWENNFNLTSKQINGIFFNYLADEEMGRGCDFFVDEDLSDDSHTYVSEEFQNKGVYEFVVEALCALEYTNF